MSIQSEARPANSDQEVAPASLFTVDPARLPIAPWWHTASVLIVLGVGSVSSFHQHGFPNFNIPGLSVNLSGYLTVIAEEWFLVLLLWLWLTRKGLSMTSLTSDRWRTPKAVLRDVGFGLGFLIVGMPLTGILAFLLKVKSASTNIFPHTPIETGVYVVLALTAGYCEELIFRGYLMQQLTARTNSRSLGILLQAVAFGLAHGYQGIGRMGIIIAYGCLFGAFVTWRKSLLPAMVAHGTQDMVTGLIFFFRG